MLTAEYPALTLTVSEDHAADKVTGFGVIATIPGDDGETQNVGIVPHQDKVPDLADILAACEEAGVDPEQGAEEEEEKHGGSVVDSLYRQQYKEQSSTGRCNGDWLAEYLAANTLDGKKNLMMDVFEQILTQNDVSLQAPWANNRANGWRGRFRMNGRRALERNIALANRFVDDRGEEVQVPEDFLASLRTKYKAAIAKAEKAAKAAMAGEPGSEASEGEGA